MSATIESAAANEAVDIVRRLRDEARADGYRQGVMDALAAIRADAERHQQLVDAASSEGVELAILRGVVRHLRTAADGIDERLTEPSTHDARYRDGYWRAVAELEAQRDRHDAAANAAADEGAADRAVRRHGCAAESMDSAAVHLREIADRDDIREVEVRR